MLELWRLGVDPATRQPQLGFDLRTGTDGPVTTGHADGLITLDTTEAEPAHLEAMSTPTVTPKTDVVSSIL